MNLKPALGWLSLGLLVAVACNPVLDVGTADAGAGGGGGGAAAGGAGGGGAVLPDGGPFCSSGFGHTVQQSGGDVWRFETACNQCVVPRPGQGQEGRGNLDAGQPCVDQRDCQAYCCPCGTSGDSFTASACLFGVCADAAAACDKGLHTPPSSDAGTDQACRAAKPSPAVGGGSFSVSAVTLVANCQPIVAKDPVALSGQVSASAPFIGMGLGPVAVSRGRFLGAQGDILATFAATGLSTQVDAGAVVTFSFQKTPGSMAPASACNTLPCGALVSVELSLSGTNVAPNTSVVSAPVRVDCVF